jgi:hypothetical protein
VAEKDEAPLTTGDVEDEPTNKRRFPTKLVAAIGAVVLIVLIVLPGISMLSPGYYERYPDLHVRMDNWRGSTHARIPCSGCHIEPGVVGYLKFGAKSIPAFYSQLVFGPKPANLFAIPSRAACQKCHTAYRQVSAGGDLLIPHKAHVEALGINCATCHKNLVHSANSQGFNKPEMSACLASCHNGVKATNQCSKCHTQKQVPPSHKSKDWLTVHSTQVGTVDCGKCHAWSPDYCKQCHSKRPESHAGNWKKLHAVRAKAQGTKGCLVCHKQAFCNKCH